MAKDGAMLDGRNIAHIRASTVQQRREEVHAALYCAAGATVWWRSGTIVKNSSQTRKQSGFVLREKVELRSIARSGVRPPAKTVV